MLLVGLFIWFLILVIVADIYSKRYFAANPQVGENYLAAINECRQSKGEDPIEGEYI